MSALTDAIAAAAQFSFGLVATQTGTPRLTALDVAWSERSDAVSAARDNKYQFYQWYYDGSQRDPLDESFTDGTVPTVEPTFSRRHNFMAVVVDVMVERLAVEAFSVDRDGDAATPGQTADALVATAKQLWYWWQCNRMDDMQGSVHTQALIKGDAFVLCDYDAAYARPRFTFNDALNITPIYDAHHRMEAAYKTWVERYTDAGGRLQLRYRLTKYSPDRIEKFTREGIGGTWRLWASDLDADGQPDGGVIDWTDRSGQPLGIPVIHFRNRPRGNDFGRSELDDLIPAQDSYNDRHLQADNALRYGGGPQKYVVNVTPPADGWASGPDVVWRMEALDPNKPVAVGQFSAGNVIDMQDGVDRQLKTIAAMSRIPMHLLWPEGGLPSGESLKTAEAGLVSKCTDRSITFGNAWEDLMALASRVHNAFGTGALIDEALTISTEWGNPATRSELADAQATALMVDALSERERLRRYGYNEQEIDKILAEKEADTPAGMRLADQFARSADTTQQGEEA